MSVIPVPESRRNPACWHVCSRRKASFSCSQHERLSVFEILGLRRTNTTQPRRYYTTKNTAHARARAAEMRAMEKKEGERRRRGRGREGEKKNWRTTAEDEGEGWRRQRDGEEKKNTCFLGRRDVVDIGPERQRHRTV